MAMFAEARRFLGSVCRFCNSNAVQKTQYCRRSRSLNNEIVCQAIMPYSTRECTSGAMNDVNLCERYTQNQGSNEKLHPQSTGVHNLTKLLEMLPTTCKELAQTIDHICEVTKTLERCPHSIVTNKVKSPSTLEMSENVSSSTMNKHLLDGRYLDELYDIDNTNLFGRKKLNGKTDINSIHNAEKVISLLDKMILNSQNKYQSNQIHSGVQLDETDSKLVPTSSTASSHLHHITCITTPTDLAESQHVLFCDGGSPSGEGVASGGSNENQHLPTPAELEVIHKHFESYLPYLFSSQHDYRLYTKDVIFENNFVDKPYVSKGLRSYVLFVAKSRAWAHFKYANVRMHVLKITSNEQDGTVHVRWRVSGIPQVRAFMFWKFLPWTYKSALKDESQWLDGFSTFYVQPKTGLIYKHRLDKVMPDEEPAVQNPKEKLVDKLRSGLNVGTV